MKRKKAYSTDTNAKTTPLEEVEGVVSKSELTYYFKEATLEIKVNGKKFHIGGKAGAPRIDVGETVVLHLSSRNKNVDAIQVLSGKKVKIRYIFYEVDFK